MRIKKYHFQIGLVLFFLWIQNPIFSNNTEKQNPEIDSLLHLIQDSKSDSVKVYSLVNISYLFSTYNMQQSISYAEKALSTAKKSRNESLRLYAVFNAGNSFFQHGIFDRASNYFYEYLNAQKQSGNKIGQAYAYSNIGAIRLKMDDPQYAKKNFLKALSLLEPSKEDQDVQSKLPNIYNNLGIVYQNLQAYDSALWYYQHALKNAKQMDNSALFQSSIYNNIGHLYQDWGQLEKVIEPLRTAMKIRIEHQDLAGQATSHGNLGDFFMQKGERNIAKDHYYKALNLSDQIGSMDMQRMFSQKLYQFFDDENQSDSALKYFKKYFKVNQEINDSETYKELTRLEITSQYKEREKLTKLKQKRIQQMYLFVSLVLLLLLLIFIQLFYLKNNRVKRLGLEKNNLLLASQNTALEKENLEKELEIRNKELTTHVMGMIRKNETIGEMVDILSNNLPKENEAVFQKIIRNLNTLQDDHVWEEFEIRYQQVHNKFYMKLNQQFPNLTINERRLCAFLRLNMTTKDIASITGQSVRSIEVARTRLRKKLEITNSDVSLVEFLNSL